MWCRTTVARAAHRLALDHPGSVKRLVLMDIASTLAMYEPTNQLMATAYFLWFFLIQPTPLPEQLLGGSPAFVIDATMLALSKKNIGAFPPEILSEYKRHFRDPATIHAICEDYRAGASIDLDYGRADLSAKEIMCPTLVLWGETGLVGKMFDVIEVWRTPARRPERSQVRRRPADISSRKTRRRKAWRRSIHFFESNILHHAATK